MILPFSVQGNSTKEKIIEILAEKWPLTAKKIYKDITKQYRLSITYQAAYKALQELTGNKILEKKKKGYMLNKEWIEKLGEFSKKIQEDLENANKRRSKTTEKIIFDEHSEFIKFHMNFLEKIIKNEKKANMIFYFRHVPYPHSLSLEDIEKLRSLLPKIKLTFITKYATLLDKWCAKYWKRLGIGVKVKMGQDIPTDTMLFIMNSHIMSLYLPRKAIREWDKIFAIKNINNVDMNRMTKTLLNKKFKTTVTVTKDKDLAQQLTAR